MTAQIVNHVSRREITPTLWVKNGRSGDLHLGMANRGQLWERVAEKGNQGSFKPVLGVVRRLNTSERSGVIRAGKRVR